jgi:hypothetical protein
MKRSGLRHPKTRALARELNIPLPHAIGLLSLLFDFVGEYATAGNVGKFTDIEIAVGSEWSVEDAGQLTSALLKVGYFEAHEVHRFVVHDWLDHCEDFVKKRLERQNRGSGGTIPEMSGNGASANPSQPSANPTQPKPTIAHRNEKKGFTKAQIEQVYQAYPRKVGKGEALKAISKALDTLAKDHPDITIDMHPDDVTTVMVCGVHKFAASPSGQNGKFTPYPATWFNQKRYLDDPDEWQTQGAQNNGRNDAAARRTAKRDREFEYKGEQPADLKLKRK